MLKRIQVRYSGRVQGVGFRFTTRDIASQMGVLGWVKNLRDGRVEMTAEAEEEILKNFLERINQYFSCYIQNADTQWQEAAGGFKDFRIGF